MRKNISLLLCYMSKLKLQNSLEKTNYVKTLILKAICEIKTLVVDFHQHKLNQQLINDVINFIDKEIKSSKFAKEDIDKIGIITDIMVAVFGQLSETELQILQSSIQFIIDNNLIKKRTLLKKSILFVGSVISTISQK